MSAIDVAQPPTDSASITSAVTVHALRLPSLNINPKIPTPLASTSRENLTLISAARLATDHCLSKRLRPAEQIPLSGPFYDQTKILCRSAAHRIQQLGSNCAIINGAVTCRHRNFEMNV
jgi:hypothetical protein